MNRRLIVPFGYFIAFLVAGGCLNSHDEHFVSTDPVSELRKVFPHPGGSSGPRCWWWLNGNITRDAIARDLEAMKDKGFSGAMIFDAGTETWWGPDDNPPNGPIFGGPEWTELGLSIRSGWNLGGPGVTLDEKAKQVPWPEPY